MDSPIYLRVGQTKGKAVVPSKNIFTLWENMDKVQSKTEAETAKGCD